MFHILYIEAGIHYHSQPRDWHRLPLSASRLALFTSLNIEAGILNLSQPRGWHHFTSLNLETGILYLSQSRGWHQEITIQKHYVIIMREQSLDINSLDVITMIRRKIEVQYY